MRSQDLEQFSTISNITDGFPHVRDPKGISHEGPCGEEDSDWDTQLSPSEGWGCGAQPKTYSTLLRLWRSDHNEVTGVREVQRSLPQEV